ncbi:hypothetical protein [Shewanella colwelliana]|uniref:hypothetical protein n=1 Tax=Shewanella colwelliana TaxID=23 RepID=UPI0022AF7813|nr:hypothetical protein [Shewanella colwelliana]MCZ4337725.1 hypothetical protein [Shewanella colwelliana]
MLSIVPSIEADWVKRYVKQCRYIMQCSKGFPLFIEANSDWESSIEMYKLPTAIASRNYQIVKAPCSGKILDLRGVLSDFVDFISQRAIVKPPKGTIEDQARIWLNAYLHNIPLRNDVLGYHYDGSFIFPEQNRAKFNHQHIHKICG